MRRSTEAPFASASREDPVGNHPPGSDGPRKTHPLAHWRVAVSGPDSAISREPIRLGRKRWTSVEPPVPGPFQIVCVTLGNCCHGDRTRRVDLPPAPCEGPEDGGRHDPHRRCGTCLGRHPRRGCHDPLAVDRPRLGAPRRSRHLCSRTTRRPRERARSRGSLDPGPCPLRSRLHRGTQRRRTLGTNRRGVRPHRRPDGSPGAGEDAAASRRDLLAQAHRPAPLLRHDHDPAGRY